VNLLSTIYVRTEWTSKLIVQRLLTWRGKGDFFKAFRRRKQSLARIYPIRLSRGSVFVDGQTAIIDLRAFAQVFLDNVYSRLELEHSVVVDVGAHKGYFSAYSFLRGAKAIIAYEPEMSNFAALSLFAQSCSENNGLIELHQMAIGEDGETEFYVSQESWCHSTIARSDIGLVKTVTVPSRTLGSALSDVRNQFPQDKIILKIDAEGAECPLLLETSPILFANVKEIIFEFHSFSKCSLEQLVNRMTSIGY
jgi:FkbM family methyltransferase